MSNHETEKFIEERAEHLVSNCCSAPVDEFEICSDCKEPCEAVETN